MATTKVLFRQEMSTASSPELFCSEGLADDKEMEDVEGITHGNQ